LFDVINEHDFTAKALERGENNRWDCYKIETVEKDKCNEKGVIPVGSVNSLELIVGPGIIASQYIDQKTHSSKIVVVRVEFVVGHVLRQVDNMGCHNAECHDYDSIEY
jgi:hypothetical protein